MSKIINFDEEVLECVVVLDINKNAHVIPVAVFERIINGTMNITELDDWELIIRSLLKEVFYGS